MQEKLITGDILIVGYWMKGSSFVITKKGLSEARDRHGFEVDGYSYFKQPLWWAGMVIMVIGELANFAAYAFAPAILVTPLGALSVLIGAVLGTHFLNERLGTLGKIGCATCLIGSIIIVLHAPPDKDVTDMAEMLHYALQPAFLIFSGTICVFSVVMIYKVAPIYGRRNPLIYLSICSTVGSISIMAIKALGIALKLTFQGNNQLLNPSTYVFAIVVVVCILVQMNYFNKALAQFSTNIVNPLYYVTFTTSTLTASFILFRGFNTSDPVNTISLLCGFLIIFSGVYLLNLSREDPEGATMLGRINDAGGFDAVPTDAVGAFQTRRSMQSRRSDVSLEGYPLGPHSRHSSGAFGRSSLGDREGLMRGFDEQQARASESPAKKQRDRDVVFERGLKELAEDSEEEVTSGGSGKRTSFDEERGIGKNAREKGGKTGKTGKGR
ncbi:DUF803 domain membrane protein [Patellaria atrata CBS 101060]|uniref:DUF803 domain membrane protein n=1 Tax=Patellaria atrata CBS 101060 TaxID=1346257 RepID=A0A9P4SJ65_9PEZI|nr:DUF803 domain membrane protein [Patellaria atrata CBS 101060]